MHNFRPWAVLLSLVLLQTTRAGQLNIQINGHNNNPQGGPDPAPSNYHGPGVIPDGGNYWNHVTADSYGHPLTIISPTKFFAADGATPANIALAFTGFASADYFPTDQGAPVTNNLLNGYLVYRPGASVTIGGLTPRAAYDVFIFGSNSRAGCGGQFSVNGSAPETSRGDNSGTPFTKGADFAAFLGVPADRHGRLILTANPSSGDIGILNGFQIVGEIPRTTPPSNLPDAKRFALAKFTGWVDEQNTFSTAPPFSFTYDGKSSGQSLDEWKRSCTTNTLDANRTEYTVTWDDPQTGLKVRCVGIAYNDFPTVEWTPYLKNCGTNDTPLIEDFLAVDTTFIRGAAGEFTLNYQRGSLAQKDDYEPLHEIMGPKAMKQIATTGGRPCNAYLPYFNIQWPGQGIVLAVGWPGQWSATFVRDPGNGLKVKAGQELTHFRLHPGEEVRGPLMAAEFYTGDLIAGQNMWRQWMLVHNVPRVNGQLPKPSWMACSSHQFHEMQEANETNQELFIKRYLQEGLKLDYWWMDAGWYVQNGSWVNTGTWEVDKKRFPDGLRAVTDFAHARGVKTVLWFEPERVTNPSWLWDHHPSWLLKPAALPPQLAYQAAWRLLNLGNPDARNWLTDHIGKLIKQEGIDFYRQDFNMDPLYFWRANDAKDREGITENFYVQGYLKYWDDLKRRNPTLRIDSCASGGRRNDLETMRRAVPLLRDDYLFDPTGEQSHTYGLSFWLPFNGTGFIDRHSILTSKIGRPFWLPADGSRPIENNSYLFRSVMDVTMNACIDMQDPQVNFKELRKLYSQWREVAPDYYGDFYPLTPYSLNEASWVAWLFYRPDTGEGIVQAFRRHESFYQAARFKLRGLDGSARYTATDMDTGRTIKATGKELMGEGILIDIHDQPGAALIRLKKSGK